jgi:RNA polymerase sigma-70 factor (ECF subfamily)
MQRYAGAAYRYLLGSLRDPDAADELTQEFALRFVRGDFRRADPGRGRFRRFVKTALFHMVVDYRKRRHRRSLPLIGDGLGAWDFGRKFDQGWRDELLSRARQAFAASPRRADRAYFVVLRLRADHPDLPSHELAARLQERLGRPLTAAGVRQVLHRARERLAELLLDEVARSLNGPTPEELEQELIDLELHRYCRPALRRREVD